MRVLLILAHHSPMWRAMASHVRHARVTLDIARDASEASALVVDFVYDVIVLDVTAPSSCGLSLLLHWRRQGLSTPVLAVTPADPVPALSVGADDVLSIPFHGREILARIRALTRRAQAAAPPHQRVHDVEINALVHSVTRDGRAIQLTPTEFALLHLLMSRCGDVVARDEIRHRLERPRRCSKAIGIHTLIRRLRKKIDQDFEPKLILTCWGVGYMFRGEDKTE